MELVFTNNACWNALQYQQVVLQSSFIAFDFCAQISNSGRNSFQRDKTKTELILFSLFFHYLCTSVPFSVGGKGVYGEVIIPEFLKFYPIIELIYSFEARQHPFRQFASALISSPVLELVPPEIAS